MAGGGPGNRALQSTGKRRKRRGGRGQSMGRRRERKRRRRRRELTKQVVKFQGVPPNDCPLSSFLLPVWHLTEEKVPFSSFVLFPFTTTVSANGQSVPRCPLTPFPATRLVHLKGEEGGQRSALRCPAVDIALLPHYIDDVTLWKCGARMKAISTNRVRYPLPNKFELYSVH